MIVLRYLEGRDLRSVGKAIGTSEDAARKRVARSLEKLRKLIGGRGFSISVGALTAAMATQPSSAPAASLVGQWSTASLAAAKVSGVTALFYRCLAPATSAGVGAAVAFVATSVIVGAKDRNGEPADAQAEQHSESALQSKGSSEVGGSMLAPSEPVERTQLTLAEFVREMEEVLDLPESLVRQEQIGNLFDLAPRIDSLELGRALIAEIEPMKFDLQFTQYFGYRRGMTPPGDLFMFYIDEWPSKRGLSSPLRNSFSDWLDADPEGAIAWLEQVRRDKELGKIIYNGRELLGSDFLSYVTARVHKEQGLEAALALQIDWINSGDAELKVRNLGLKSESDFRFAWEAVRKIEAPGPRREGLNGLLGWMAAIHPPVAREIVEAVTEPRERSEFVRHFINYSLKRESDWSPERTADWGLEQTMESRRDKAFGQMASRWVLSRDPVLGLEWLDTHPELYTADALAIIGRAVRQENYSGQPGRLSPEQLAERAQMIPRIHALWKESTPAAAEEFLERSLTWLEERNFDPNQN